MFIDKIHKALPPVSPEYYVVPSGAEKAKYFPILLLFSLTHF